MSTESKPVVASEATAVPAVVIDEPKTTEVETTEAAPASAPVPVLAPALDTKTTEVVDKQPTTTHAESGTAHNDVEVATKVDGTTDKPVETAVAATTETEAETAATTETAPAAPAKTDSAEAKKEEKKVAIKEKSEKTKAEGKGLLARFFGTKDKSPKKPKVKTPKTEKADPTPVVGEETPATTAAVEEPAIVAESSKTVAPVEVTGAAITTDTAEPAPAHAEAPAVPTMDTKPTAEAVKAPEVLAAGPATTETKADETVAAGAKDESAVSPRNLKATRRLSARFTSFVHKMGGKRDGATTPPKEKEDKEATKEVADAHAQSEPTAISDEAPKLDKPVPAEPLKLEETKPSAPPAAATVPTAA